MLDGHLGHRVFVCLSRNPDNLLFVIAPSLLGAVFSNSGLYENLRAGQLTRKSLLLNCLLDGEVYGAGYVDISVYDVYCSAMTSKELIALLKEDGWTLRGSKGSHHVFVHASKAGHLTVPHPKKDLGTGLVQKILKQAGLK